MPIKLSALVKERSIYTKENYVQMGPVSEEDTTHYSLKVENHGVKDLTISEIARNNEHLKIFPQQRKLS